MPFTLGLQDYELVRGLLQSPLVGSADESFDPLTADMVNRANVFMAVKCESGQEDNTVCSLDGGDVHRRNHNARPPRELITRRQVADLGNVRSRTVRRLVEHLQNQPDGYERFRQMGLLRRLPDRKVWRKASVDDLIGWLCSWSPKQVRTHFEHLRRGGMVTAEREHGNGPWKYALPEELTDCCSAFRGLPSAQDLTGEAPAP
jgi:hypothetical protein